MCCSTSSTGRKLKHTRSIYGVQRNVLLPIDSSHLTTYPLGNMIAAWIALEPITADNGCIIHHPGSHRLPCVRNNSYGHGGTRFVIGDDACARYEVAIEEEIRKGGFPVQEFHAQPGDALLWHANLLHGGKKMTHPDASRKSMVIHCFAEDVLCHAARREDGAGPSPRHRR